MVLILPPAGSAARGNPCHWPERGRDVSKIGRAETGAATVLALSCPFPWSLPSTSAQLCLIPPEPQPRSPGLGSEEGKKKLSPWLSLHPGGLLCTPSFAWAGALVLRGQAGTGNTAQREFSQGKPHSHGSYGLVWGERGYLELP